MRAGDCSSSLSAGIKLILGPSLGAMFTRAGMLSPEGRCKTLDAGADGYANPDANPDPKPRP
jgi:acyl transferase domain-containing protein